MKKTSVLLLLLSLTTMLYIHWERTPSAETINEDSVTNASNSGELVRDFIIALSKKDEKLARTYLSLNVKIPEIREETPIRGFSGLPSPKENVIVSLAYFDDEESSNRIAFIWEIAISKDKITHINVVYDGSNPFMNELHIIKEYKNKNKTGILTASEFPFEITHVDGNVNNDILMLRYKNVDFNGLLQIKVESNTVDLKSLKRENDQFYTLNNGIKALYQPNYPPGHQLVFHNSNLKYSIGIKGTQNQNITVDDLLKIANSMFR